MWPLLVGALVATAVGHAARAEGKRLAADQAVETAARDGAAVAAPQDRAQREQLEAKQAFEQQQLARLAENCETSVQPALQAELELVRRTCGSLPADARKKILAAANERAKVFAEELAKRLFLRRAVQGQGFDAQKTIHEAVAAAVKPHAAAEEFAAYEREHAARIARRGRAARIVIVTKLDVQLELSQSQREKIESDLEKHWDAGWLRDLDDKGQMIVGRFPPAPDFADRCIAPHLDDRQRTVWKQWCQQAGWGRFPGRDVSFNPESLQPDTWWSQ